jgi:DNA polymerase-3 subunit delta
MARSRKNHEDGRQFFRRLRDDGAYARIFVVYGEEEFLIKEAEKRLVSAVFPDGSDGLNNDQYDGSSCSGSDIVDTANEIPMFARERLIRVQNADKLRAAELEIVADYAEDPMESTVLLLRGTSFDGRTKAVKALFASPNTVVVEFKALKTRETEQWVARRAAQYQLQVAHDVPPLLVESVGTSLDLLDSALERIDLFVGGDRSEPRQVRRDVVEEVVVDTRTRAWFEMTDALLQRRAADAISHFQGAYEYGESAIRTVSRVSYQFRSVLLMREGMKRGLSGKDLTDFADCRSFLADKFKRAAHEYGLRELRWILQRIAETDMLLKSSKHSDEVLVERLFLDIVSGFDLEAKVAEEAR